MSVSASDLIRYGSANHVTDDSSTVGGAIDTAARPLDSQFSAAAAPQVVSDNAGDTMNCTIVGRTSAGAISSQTQALTGTTPVDFTTLQRIHSITLASGPSGTVTVTQGSGGTTRHTFAAGETDAFTWFQRSVSATGSTSTRYEKAFWKNTSGDTDLTDAEVTLTADPNSNYRIGLDASQDASTSSTNRVTAPGGISFVDDSVAISVPGTDLEFGNAIGYWVEQSLSAGEGADQDTFTTELAGGTT